MIHTLEACAALSTSFPTAKHVAMKPALLLQQWSMSCQGLEESQREQGTSSLSQVMSWPMWMGRLAMAPQPSSNSSCSGGSTAGSHVCMWNITCNA